jgi:hypothetical protein
LTVPAGKCNRKSSDSDSFQPRAVKAATTVRARYCFQPVLSATVLVRHNPPDGEVMNILKQKVNLFLLYPAAALVDAQ